MDNNDKLNRLLEQLAELKSLRAELTSSYKNTPKDKEVDSIKEKQDALKNSNDVVEELKKQLEELDKEIDEIEDSLLKNTKEYEEAYKKLQELAKEQDETLDNSDGLLDEEHINQIRESFDSFKIRENKRSSDMGENFKKQRKRLSVLKGEKTKLRKDILSAEALDLNLQEYKEINSALRKRKVFDAILEQKGLTDIISKPNKERTKEEKVELAKAKEEIMREISQVKKVNDYSALDAIEALYSLDVSYVKGKTRVIQIPKNELAIIKENVKALPVLVNDPSKETIDYEPIEAPEDMKIIDEEIKKEETLNNEVEEDQKINERIVLFKDKNTGDFYVRNYVRDKFSDKFGKDETDEGVKINGSKCFKIEESEANYIMANADNDLSPYLTRVDEVEITKEEEKKQDEENKLTADDYNMTDEAFNALIEEGLIPGTEEFDRAVQQNGIGTPINDVEEENNNNIILDEETSDELIPGTNIKRPRYRKEDETDEEYAAFLESYYNRAFPTASDEDEEELEDEVVEENEEPVSEPEEENTPVEVPTAQTDDVTPIVARSEDDNQDTQDDDIEEEEDTQEEYFEEENDEEDDYEPLSVYDVIEKLTDDLIILKNDGKRYNATNIKVTKNFRNELKSGNVIYNIVHLPAAIIKLGVGAISKVWNKFVLGAEGRDTMKTLDERLNNLSDEELQLLYDEYKGTVALQDMNGMLLPMIQKRLRTWVLDKVEGINDDIKQNYVDFFAVKREIEAINEILEDDSLDPEVKEYYIIQRNELYRQAAFNVSEIESLRQEGNNWLSGGLHGLEEDYKAVMSKMNYVGYRFAKKHDFNNELNSEIAKYDHNMKKGLRDDNPEEVYKNFIAREQCFIDNTEIKYSIFGKRSVGEKYYTPLVEQLDYSADPLIRDLLTTVAVTTAAISVVNSLRVREIQNAQLQQHQGHVNAVNATNDQLVGKVSSEAQKIVDGRTTIRDGLQAQMHQDVVNTANTLERTALDASNWKFTKSYHALDDSNHIFYNNMYTQITSDINNVTSRLGNKTITSMEALQEMGNIANNAQSTVVDVAKYCLDEVVKYIPKHPQYDLTATREALEYIVNNPTAITAMNETAINATNIAEGLVGLSPAHVTALSVLPDDMLSTLMGAAGGTMLALNVVNSMDKLYANGKVKDKRARNDEIKNMFNGSYEEDDGDDLPYDEEDEEEIIEEIPYEEALEQGHISRR